MMSEFIEPPTSPFNQIYTTSSYSHIGDQYISDNEYYAFDNKYKKRKRIAYVCFFLISIGMLFLTALPNMYHGQPKYANQFTYFERVLNIIVPNRDYYGKDSNIGPIILTIVWYCITSLCILLTTCVYKLKHNY